MDLSHTVFATLFLCSITRLLMAWRDGAETIALRRSGEETPGVWRPAARRRPEMASAQIAVAAHDFV